MDIIIGEPLKLSGKENQNTNKKMYFLKSKRKIGFEDQNLFYKQEQHSHRKYKPMRTENLRRLADERLYEINAEENKSQKVDKREIGNLLIKKIIMRTFI